MIVDENTLVILEKFAYFSVLEKNELYHELFAFLEGNGVIESRDMADNIVMIFQEFLKSKLAQVQLIDEPKIVFPGSASMTIDANKKSGKIRRVPS